MIEEADRDNDGEIGEEEFIRIMKKTNLFWLYRIQGSLMIKALIIYKILIAKSLS